MVADKATECLFSEDVVSRVRAGILLRAEHQSFGLVRLCRDMTDWRARSGLSGFLCHALGYSLMCRDRRISSTISRDGSLAACTAKEEEDEGTNASCAARDVVSLTSTPATDPDDVDES